MDERKRASTKDDDVPIIGDYSEHANARLRAESQPAPSSQHAPAATNPPDGRASAAPRPAGEQLRVDPRDVHRYAKLARQRERVGPLGKISRYGLVAVALVAAFLVYWNFETLREVTIDFSALTSLFTDNSGTDRNGTPLPNDELKTESFEAQSVTGVGVATSVDDSPPADSSVAETPAARSELPTADIAPPPAVATAEPSPDPSPDSSPDSSPDDRLAGSRSAPPAAAPEPPAGPESFEFGLSTVNASEADASAAVIILRYGDRRRASSITWWTEDGTAKAGVDYADLGRVVEKFAAGEQNRTIHIPIIGDHKVEGPETFYVYLATSEGASPRPDSTQKLEVVIND